MYLDFKCQDGIVPKLGNTPSFAEAWAANPPSQQHTNGRNIYFKRKTLFY